jgi:hypothetical protein
MYKDLPGNSCDEGQWQRQAWTYIRIFERIPLPLWVQSGTLLPDLPLALGFWEGQELFADPELRDAET